VSLRDGGRPGRSGEPVQPSTHPGTPELAGLLPHEALPLIRSLAGIEFCGFEVSPSYDTAGLTTALNAAGVVYEFLALSAIAHRGESGAAPRFEVLGAVAGVDTRRLRI
jgi:Arginase family